MAVAPRWLPFLPGGCSRSLRPPALQQTCPPPQARSSPSLPAPPKSRCLRAGRPGGRCRAAAEAASEAEQASQEGCRRLPRLKAPCWSAPCVEAPPPPPPRGLRPCPCAPAALWAQLMRVGRAAAASPDHSARCRRAKACGPTRVGEVRFNSFRFSSSRTAPAKDQFSTATIGSAGLGLHSLPSRLTPTWILVGLGAEVTAGVQAAAQQHLQELTGPGCRPCGLNARVTRSCASLAMLLASRQAATKQGCGA